MEEDFYEIGFGEEDTEENLRQSINIFKPPKNMQFRNAADTKYG